MHNPNLQVDNNELDESFEYIFALVQDTYLQKHVEKFLSTENYYDSLQKVEGDTDRSYKASSNSPCHWICQLFVIINEIYEILQVIE